MIAHVEYADRVGMFGEVRRRLEEDAGRLLASLSERQHLKPHATLADVLRGVAMSRGLHEATLLPAADRAEIDTDRAIGRLRRVDLIRVARFAARELANG
jgi:hypothetical protein